MAKTRIYNIPSLNLRLSPFIQSEGAVIRALNVDRDLIGGWKKRSGYVSFLGTPDNAQVTTLFGWQQNNGTVSYLYRKSGGTLYYSTNGTGAWTVCGNGTFTADSRIGYTILDNTIILGDGTAVTRHSVGTTAGAGGTSFTNTSGAPLAEFFENYQGRVYAARGTSVTGTNTDLFYSTAGTASDWTTDSTSIRIPGEGRINALFKSNDRVVVSKDSGQMYRWDGFNLVDLTTKLGPTSAYSIGEVEDYKLYLNRRGVFGYGGLKPEVVSNPVQRQIYNDLGSGIAGSVFDNAPGEIHKYDYFLGVGTVTDDLTNETVPDCVLKYNFQLNEWTNWRFNNRPYAFHSYKDNTGVEKLIFGDNGGQCYQLSGTALSDNGQPIESYLEGVLFGGAPELDKKWNYIWAFTNPGCQAKIQVALANTFTKGKLKWIDLKQTVDGVMEARLPAESRSKLLFWKLYESSMTSRWQFHGFVSDHEVIERG